MILALALLLQGVLPPPNALMRPLPALPPVQPNILLVLMDDVGYWDLYGADPASTPTIDGLAGGGFVFHRVWAMPVCSPARATLLTGTYPYEHGLGSSVSGQGIAIEGVLPALLPGYASAFVGKWHVTAWGAESWNTPAMMGFDRMAGHWGNFLSETYSAWSKVRDGLDLGIETEYATLNERRELKRWIAEQDGPWFAIWGASAAHAPYHDPPGLTGATEREKFLAMIAYLDGQLASVLEVVDLANTVVIVTSDNGSPGLVRPPEISQGKAKNTVYEGGLRVPLVMAGVGIPEGESDALVGIVDLWATVLDLAGVPAGLGGSSETLLPMLAGAPPSKAYQYAERYTGSGLSQASWTKWKRAVSDGEWKLIEDQGVREMYNLVTDPDERFDKYDDPVFVDEQNELEMALGLFQ